MFRGLTGDWQTVAPPTQLNISILVISHMASHLFFMRSRYDEMMVNWGKGSWVFQCPYVQGQKQVIPGTSYSDSHKLFL